MLRAVPATIFFAASKSAALRSSILIFAIFSTCSSVIVPLSTRKATRFDGRPEGGEGDGSGCGGMSSLYSGSAVNGFSSIGSTQLFGPGIQGFLDPVIGALGENLEGKIGGQWNRSWPESKPQGSGGHVRLATSPLGRDPCLARTSRGNALAAGFIRPGSPVGHPVSRRIDCRGKRRCLRQNGRHLIEYPALAYLAAGV